MTHTPIRFALILLALLAGIAPSWADGVDFTLPDLDGRMRSLSEFRGKWVVVNYWATWCPPCLEEMSELELFHSRHHEGDAVVLGVNMENIGAARLREFVDDQFLSFPILRDRPRPATELGPVPGLPTSYLLDPAGQPVARQVGPVTAQRLERAIEHYKRPERSTGGGT